MLLRRVAALRLRQKVLVEVAPPLFEADPKSAPEAIPRWIGVLSPASSNLTRI